MRNRRNIIKSVEHLLNLITFNEIKAFKDTAKNEVYQVCLCIDPDEISVLRIGDEEETIVKIADINNEDKCGLASGLNNNTLIRYTSSDI